MCLELNCSLPDIFCEVEQYPDTRLDTNWPSNIHLKMTSVENFFNNLMVIKHVRKRIMDGL